MSRQRFESGFTLLELMVAMALSVVIATISALALSSGSDFYSKSVARLFKRSELGIVDLTLRAEWARRAGSFQIADHSIEFLTTQSRRIDGKTSAALVEYICVLNQKADYSLVHTSLEIMIDPITGRPLYKSVDGPQRKLEVVMLKDLKKCSFSALKSVEITAGKKHKLWTDQWMSEEPMPKLVKLKLSDERGDLPSYVFVAEGL